MMKNALNKNVRGNMVLQNSFLRSWSKQVEEGWKEVEAGPQPPWRSSHCPAMALRSSTAGSLTF